MLRFQRQYLLVIFMNYYDIVAAVIVYTYKVSKTAFYASFFKMIF